MELRQVDHFLDQLQQANEKGHYVTRVEGLEHVYTVVSDKNAKQMNTVRIAGVAEDCFKAYNTHELSHEKRLALMTKLRDGLEAYENRTYTQKSFFQKIGYFFGCMSNGEKIILDTIKLANTEIKVEQSALKQITKLGQWYADLQAKKSEGELYQAKFYYMKVLEGTNFRDQQFEGHYQSAGIKSYLDDLEAYRKQNGSTEKLDQAIEHLKGAYDLAILRESSSIRGILRAVIAPKMDEAAVISELERRVQEKIQDLHDNKKVGDLVLIPGGYETKDGGHAVLYQIEKTGDDTCSFTIINTGAGSEESLLSWKTAKSFFTLKDRMHVVDIQYANVMFSQLDGDFIKVIASPQFDGTNNKPMQTVIDAITEKLGATDSVDKAINAFRGWFGAEVKSTGVNKQQGREHTAQTTGSCTFKSVSSWLHGFLGSEDYKPIKVHVTENELTRLDHVIEGKREGETKDMLVRMREIGSEVLAHRKGKL